MIPAQFLAAALASLRRLEASRPRSAPIATDMPAYLERLADGHQRVADAFARVRRRRRS